MCTLLCRTTTAYRTILTTRTSCQRWLRNGVRPPVTRNVRSPSTSQQPLQRSPQGLMFGGWTEHFNLFGRKVDEEETNSSTPTVKTSKMKILKYPNPKLRAENAEIVVFDETLEKQVVDLLETMYDSDDGVGLAAPQVGLNIRLMVFNELGERSKPEKEMVLCNPVITSKSEDTDIREEGCLSFPQINGKVVRHKWVDIEYQNIKGEKVKQRLEGWPARVFQHEYDHLDKVLLVDRIVEEDLKLNAKRLEKAVKKYGAGGAP